MTYPNVQHTTLLACSGVLLGRVKLEFPGFVKKC